MATEKRLIDANALETKMGSLCDEFGTDHLFIDAIVYEIGNAPTVDAVEVVRCKDCQHWQKRHETMGICLKHNAIVTFTTPDFYCACGERRTDHV